MHIHGNTHLATTSLGDLSQLYINCTLQHLVQSLTGAAVCRYRSEVQRLRSVFRTAVAGDVARLKEAVGEYKENTSRLQCQKQLLLKQVRIQPDCSWRNLFAFGRGPFKESLSIQNGDLGCYYMPPGAYRLPCFNLS